MLLHVIALEHSGDKFASAIDLLCCHQVEHLLWDANQKYITSAGVYILS
jgi:hypothetical protein